MKHRAKWLKTAIFSAFGGDNF